MPSALRIDNLYFLNTKAQRREDTKKIRYLFMPLCLRALCLIKLPKKGLRIITVNAGQIIPKVKDADNFLRCCRNSDRIEISN